MHTFIRRQGRLSSSEPGRLRVRRPYHSSVYQLCAPLACAAIVPPVCVHMYQLCARSVAERGWQALRAGLLGLCSTTGVLAMGSRWPCATRLGSPLSTQGSHCWVRHASLPSVFQFQHSLLNSLEGRRRVGPRSHRGGARGACGPGLSVTTCVPCVWEHTWRFYGRVAGEVTWSHAHGGNPSRSYAAASFMGSSRPRAYLST